MSTVTTEPILLTPEEVASRLKVSQKTVYRYIAAGRLPALRLGGRGTPIRVDERELSAWLYGTPDAGAAPSGVRDVPPERDAPPSSSRAAVEASPLAGHEERGE